MESSPQRVNSLSPASLTHTLCRPSGAVALLRRRGDPPTAPRPPTHTESMLPSHKRPSFGLDWTGLGHASARRCFDLAPDHAAPSRWQSLTPYYLRHQLRGR
jgi:hypothetical protein